MARQLVGLKPSVGAIDQPGARRIKPLILLSGNIPCERGCI
jgi:hypothetical protein